MRWTLVAAVALAAAGLSVVLWRVAGRNAAGPIDAVEGSEIRNLRHVRYVGTTPVLRVNVEEGVLRRPKVGAFRIGFTRELVARNVSIEITFGDHSAKGFDPTAIGSILGDALRSAGMKEEDVTSISITGLRFRMLRPDGDWLELRADSCSASMMTRGRLALHNVVESAADNAELHFATLEFDPRRRTFVAASLPASRQEAHATHQRIVEKTLEHLNCSIDRLITETNEACPVAPDLFPRGDPSPRPIGRSPTGPHSSARWRSAALRAGSTLESDS